jgi:hypothetical protein
MVVLNRTAYGPACSLGDDPVAEAADLQDRQSLLGLIIGSPVRRKGCSLIAKNGQLSS